MPNHISTKKSLIKKKVNIRQDLRTKTIIKYRLYTKYQNIQLIPYHVWILEKQTKKIDIDRF